MPYGYFGLPFHMQGMGQSASGMGPMFNHMPQMMNIGHPEGQCFPGSGAGLMNIR